jgi:putative NIF3 family GTP cyclohydrolase 1 type 2
MDVLSRRSFLVSATAIAAAPLSTVRARAALSAADVIQRITDRVGVPWRTETVDRIIAGTAHTTVKGIATTMMSTMDVVQRAASAGRNMIVTHEPTFYSHQDGVNQLKDDPAYRYKDAFIRDHGIVIFRFHDHWHARRPDGIATGMVQALGWEKYVSAENPRQFTLPSTTLGELARQLQSRLQVRTMRVVGDPSLSVTRVAASWGYFTFTPTDIPLSRPDVDVFVVGETREWETVEHAQDLIASGAKKGLIILGHVVSEQAGMKYCADWLKGFVTEVPIDFVPAAEPFWRP